MATKIEITFNSDGFKEILNSEGVRQLVEQVANAVKARADANITEDSEGFRVKVWQGSYGGGRWVGHVMTSDFASMKAESEDKALTKAVRG